jgi:hypothetical protein
MAQFTVESPGNASGVVVTSNLLHAREIRR